MGTNDIRSRHEETYRRFFERNDLVMSGCYSMSWGNDLIDHQSAFPVVQMKIPLKCYAGFKKADSAGAHFVSVIQYRQSTESFETVAYHSVNAEASSAETKIHEFLRSKGFPSGIEIEILTEIPRGHSFGFSETSFSLVSLGCHVLSGAVTSEALQDFGYFQTDPLWKKVVDFAWSLSLDPRVGNTIAHGIRNTLSDACGPMVYYCEKFEHSGEIRIEDLARGEFGVAAISWSDPKKAIPFDFGVVFSGITGDSRQIEEFKQADKDLLDRTNGFQKSLSETMGEDFGKVPWMWEKRSPYGIFRDLKTFLNIKSVELFDRAFRSGWHDESIVEAFIENVNHYRYLLSFISKQGNFAENFTHAFQKYRGGSEERVGICPLYSGKFGGGYLIVTKPGISRLTLEKTMEEMRMKLPDCYPEYLSYVHGTEGDPPMLEQFASSGLASEYVKEGQVLYRDNLWETKIGPYGEMAAGNSEGITVDAIAKKIYLRWEKLTSKEVPSQNAAADLLRILVNEIGEEVSNRRLPASSYSKNKNEFVGKILAPLTKLVKERTSDHIPLRCFGTINDFRIVLDRGGIRIGIIQKM